jgi:Na+/H+ antiporter NhaD/arsenite permease-like protein
MADDAQGYQHEHLEEELEDLRKELEHFQKEKERVRAIVGKIGGVPKTQAKIINIVFILVIGVSLIVSILGGEQWRLLMIEIATVALSIKIIYLIHSQMRVAHFEFWILSSLEWRINEIMKQLRELRKDTGKN